MSDDLDWFKQVRMKEVQEAFKRAAERRIVRMFHGSFSDPLGWLNYQDFLAFERTRRHRCPFDFLTDFDRWFEFKKRTIADRELSADVLDSMGVSIDEMQRLAIITIRVWESVYPVVLEPRNLIKCSSY